MTNIKVLQNNFIYFDESYQNSIHLAKHRFPAYQQLKHRQKLLLFEINIDIYADTNMYVKHLNLSPELITLVLELFILVFVC